MDIRDGGVILVSILLRFSIFNLDFVAFRPEVNSPTNSFFRLTEDRYEPNQSIIPKALFSLVQQEIFEKYFTRKIKIFIRIESLVKNLNFDQ